MRPKDSSLTWRRGDLDFLREIFCAIRSGDVLTGTKVKSVWVSISTASTMVSTASRSTSGVLVAYSEVLGSSISRSGDKFGCASSGPFGLSGLDGNL